MLMWIIWVHSVIKKCAKFRDPPINFSWVLFRFKFEHFLQLANLGKKIWLGWGMGVVWVKVGLGWGSASSRE